MPRTSPARRAASACALTALATLAPAFPALAAPSPAQQLRTAVHAQLRSSARAAGDAQRRAADPSMPGAASTTVDHVPGQVIVTFRADASEAERRAAVRAVGGHLGAPLATPEQALVLLPDNASAGAARDQLDKAPAVADAVLDYKVALTSLPNDAQLGNQYGLTSPLSGFASPDADIEASGGWDVSTGSGVTVAVIDQGIDLDHPDLASQIAYNDGERGNGKETNGIDDDHNGYVDDWRGWDTGNNSNDPALVAEGASPWHGTHVAGIIAARANDGSGVAGVAYNAKLLPIQATLGGLPGAVFPDAFATSDLLMAIRYAAVRHADIVNMSLAVQTPADQPVIKDAIAEHPDMLFVAAAGNDSKDLDNDSIPNAPCTVALDNVLCVGSSNDRGQISWSYSNYGKQSVDLFAPGERVVSTLPNGETAEVSGTSMAAPVVSGAAADYKSKFPSATPVQIKQALMDTVDPIKGAMARSVSGGRLNLDRALHGAGAQAAGTVSVSGGTLTFKTTSVATTQGVVAYTRGTDIVVEGRSTTMTPGAGCAAETPTRVACASSGVTALTLTGSTGADRLVNDTELPATINGGTGPDTLLGGTAADVLNGGAGSDTLQGFGGGDTLNGGTETDTVTYGDVDASAVVTVSLDGQRNDGTNGADLVGTDVEKVVGHIGPDDLTGSESADSLYGIGGDDILEGAGGDDTIDGGPGKDTVRYAAAPSAVTVNLGAPSPQATGGEGSDTLAGIEGILGSRYDDVLTGDAGDNTLDGFIGTDHLDGGAGSDWFEAAIAAKLSIDLRITGPQAAGNTGQKTLANIENIRGTDGNDTLIGNDGNNVLAPGLGNDTVDGLGGADTLSYTGGGIAATAPSAVTVDLANTGPQDTVGAGIDTVRNLEGISDTAGSDTLYGTTGGDDFTLTGGDYDKIDGRGGDDLADFSSRNIRYKEMFAILSKSTQSVRGGGPRALVTNVKSIVGTNGSDTFNAAPGDNLFAGGPADDTVSYGEAPGPVTVNLGLTRAQNTGSSGFDQLFSIERLSGSAYGDTLTGNAKRNIIRGYTGADQISSGGGSDMIYVDQDNTADTVSCGDGEDWVAVDNGGIDQLDSSCEPALVYSQDLLDNWNATH